jgi:sugar lactone lactonase YvrE
MNDCTADSRGRLYSGTTYFDAAADYKLGYLLRVDNAGKTSILDEGFHLSNGLAFSPDDRTLYFTDSIARRIYAYDYDLATGNIRNRRVLVDVPRTEGVPDGLAVDSEGFLWSAQWYGSSIVRYDPDGKVERRIATPAKQTSCCAFGGADRLQPRSRISRRFAVPYACRRSRSGSTQSQCCDQSMNPVPGRR